jgi:hypothetical protein
MKDKKLIEDHVRNLIRLFESDNVVKDTCPNENKYWEWEKYERCRACLSFVGLCFDEENPCPCDQLGVDEAVKQSWIAIDECSIFL